MGECPIIHPFSTDLSKKIDNSTIYPPNYPQKKSPGRFIPLQPQPPGGYRIGVETGLRVRGPREPGRAEAEGSSGKRAFGSAEREAGKPRNGRVQEASGAFLGARCRTPRPGTWRLHPFWAPAIPDIRNATPALPRTSGQGKGPPRRRAGPSRQDISNPRPCTWQSPYGSGQPACQRHMGVCPSPYTISRVNRSPFVMP